MKVENIRNKANRILNQFIIEDDDGNTFFQSYKSIIVKIDSNGVTTLDEKFWDYSVTTGKYRNIFLGETKKETENKIKTGVYRLGCLNEG